MQEQTNRMKKRILAILLVFTLTFGNFALVGSWSYAAGVEFFRGSDCYINAYFAGQGNDTTMQITQDVNMQARMNIDIDIHSDGYIKDGVIEITRKDGKKDLTYDVKAVMEDHSTLPVATPTPRWIRYQARCGTRLGQCQQYP